ncbi:tyrosine-protein kinase RYK-like [Watersipora subatra]|uniref:tyrosine-protein kinase RYK-like n=1 Tax=Watersipora subatra TaxID=2589382 RepID=UPI00355C0ACB
MEAALKLIVFFALPSITTGQLTLYMSQNETQKLFGFNAEVVYVLRDQLMPAALSALVTLNSSYNEHILHWRNDYHDKQVGYAIDFTVTPSDGIETPVKMNTTLTGVIPSQNSAFSMTFNCTGQHAAVDVGVRLTLSNWLHQNSTSFRLTRRKLCTVVGVTSGDPAAITNQDSPPDVFVSGEKLRTPTRLPKPSSTEIFYVAVGIASTIIILVAAIIFILYVRTRRQTLLHNDRPSVIGSSNHGSSHLRLDGNKHSSLLSLPSSRRGTLSSYSQPPHTQDVRVTLQSLTISRKSVSIGETLLEGVFGKLQQGAVYVQDESEECYERKVLIKTVSDEASEEQIQSLMADGSMLKGLTHQCINPIIAACLGDTPLLIYPSCDLGNLKALLTRSNRISQSVPVLNTQQLVSMAMQVVKGLHYLHRKHLIHKDIATRNCCVDEEFNVKVTDNALSRDLFPDDYVHLHDGELIPVKWMAFETLTDGKYMYETDIWSFGVLLWELITLGQQPYSDVDPSDMSSYLYSGCRLLQPVNCPDELFAVMAYCWAVHSCDRPSLPQILACLQEFYTTLSAFV